MPKSFDDEDVVETEATIPEPPTGTPEEVARRAWQVAWSASNAAASYHASLITHLLAHERRISERIGAEMQAIRSQIARDLDDFKKTLLAALSKVGIHVDLTPSGHSQSAISVEPERISSHDLEISLTGMSERLEEHFDERIRALPASIPSERVKELLTQERARVEAQQQIMRLELEKKQMEQTHAGEIARLNDKRVELAEANARWLRIGLMIASGVGTILAGLFWWALTKHPPNIGP